MTRKYHLPYSAEFKEQALSKARQRGTRTLESVANKMSMSLAHCPSKDSNGQNQPAERDIAVVSDRVLGEFQRKAVDLTKGSSEREIMTNCRDEMLSAMGKEEPKLSKEDRQNAREQSKERSADKGAEQETAPKKQDKQREMSM